LVMQPFDRPPQEPIAASKIGKWDQVISHRITPPSGMSYRWLD